MEYFLGKEEINKINESNFDEIKCIARYNITENNANFSWSKFTVENNTIICRNGKFFTKFLYSGSLPSESTSGENLPSYSTYERTTDKLVHLNVVKDEYTLLYVREIYSNKNILFDNGMESLRLNCVIHAIIKTEFYNNYLAIITENIEKNDNTEEPTSLGFILIKVIPKSDNEDILVEVFQTNLYDMSSFNLPNLSVERIIFNSSMNSSKLLLVFKRNAILTFNIKYFIMTFNIKTLQFSALLDLEECEPFSSYSSFYCYNNILKDLIILLSGNNLYLIRESNENSLYIYKKSSIPLPGRYIIDKISLCNNQNNEIILFININSLIENENGDSDDSDEPGDWISFILSYNVLNGKTCETFRHFNNILDINSRIFFNPSGEEIFVKHENQLEIYVYKSKVRSLKRTCQILVLEQYSSEQLNRMNLPKYLLLND